MNISAISSTTNMDAISPAYEGEIKQIETRIKNLQSQIKNINQGYGDKKIKQQQIEAIQMKIQQLRAQIERIESQKKGSAEGASGKVPLPEYPIYNNMLDILV